MPGPTHSSAPRHSRPGGRDPYAVIRPRRGRVVAIVAAVVVLAGFTFSAIVIPGQESQKEGWTVADRLALFGMGLAIAGFLWRLASIRATPSREGLVVRNLFITRRFAWGQVLRMQFGGGSPWASIDLSDTDTVAVMAIQKADGARGREEAARLAALIEYHSTVREPGPADADG